MALTRKGFLRAGAAISAATLLASCRRQKESNSAPTDEQTPQVELGEFKSLELDMNSWHYDAEHEVWWQVGLTYCKNPASSTTEKLGMYVPGSYLKPKDSTIKLSEVDPSATIACELNQTGSAGSFTCTTAPIVMPINCPEFQAQVGPTSYLFDGLDPYLSAGMVYVYVGCRGRSGGYDSSSKGEGFYSGGAPWGIVDLKAAVRYLRYNTERIPGSTERIVTFGQAAGGLLSAIMGSTGDSTLFDPYLKEIGAITHDDNKGLAISDAISAVMSWCPEPSASIADSAYEWELGQFSEKDSRAEGTWTKLLSDDLAASYASYINGLALRDDSGKVLLLDETDGGIYTDGTYYEALVQLIEASATQFLSKTVFPYTATKTHMLCGQFPGSGTKIQEASVPRSGLSVEADSDENISANTAADERTTQTLTGFTEVVSQRYATRSEYVSALNEAARWLTYNERRKSARLLNLNGYVRSCRQDVSPVLSFDSEKRASAANLLFGTDDTSALHFSKENAEVLKKGADKFASLEGFDPGITEAFDNDLTQTDTLKQTIETRCNMYNPFYFISGSAVGFGTAKVAPKWRINIGLSDNSAPISTGYNLFCALKAYDGVDNPSFTAVWGEGKALAEADQADGVQAFISWVGSLYPTS